MAELATDPKKASESIKPREIGAGSEGAARNLLVTALIALSVTVGLLAWQTSSSFLVIVAGILCPSAWFGYARRSCMAIEPRRDDPDDAHRFGYYLGRRKDSGPSTSIDAGHGCAA
jgi:hypothetical protein